VARVILHASRRPRRNIYLTASGRAALVMQWAVPSAMDRIMLHAWRRASGTEPGRAKLKGDEMR
jgi:hypothetical protein